MARHPHWHCHCHCRWSFLRKGELAQPLIDEEGEEKEEDVAQVFCFHWVLHNVYSWDFCEFSIKSKPATLLTKGFLQLVMPLQHTVDRHYLLDIVWETPEIANLPVLTIAEKPENVVHERPFIKYLSVMDKSHHGWRPQDQEQPGNMKLSRIPHMLNAIHTF